MYCVIELAEPSPFFLASLTGIDPLYPSLSLVRFNDLACVVSDSALKEYPVTREYSLKHQQIIEEVMKIHPVLPIAFSTVAKSSENILSKVLEPRYQEFKNLLRWVSDKVELGLKVYWKEISKLFEVITEERKEIRILKETIAAKPPAATYYDRIELGKMVKTAFEKKKEQEEVLLLEALRPHAVDMKTNSTYGDEMILSAAFFIEKAREAEFDQAIQELAARSNGNLRFKYVGPVPPFNFVTVRIKWE